MGSVTTIKGSLFDAPKGTIIIHACNTKGSWGAGIAREFARRFPKAYETYHEICLKEGHLLLGRCLLIPDKSGYVIGCLFTSKGYGRYAGTPANILLATRLAIADLILQNPAKLPMHMCKINSGLFRVPWDDSKAILKDSGQEFTVYDF